MRVTELFETEVANITSAQVRFNWRNRIYSSLKIFSNRTKVVFEYLSSSSGVFLFRSNTQVLIATSTLINIAKI